MSIIFFYLVALVERQKPGVDPLLDSQVSNLVEVRSLHVQNDRAIHQHAAQLEQRVKRQRGDMRLRPPVSSLFDVFFELHPPVEEIFNKKKG